MTEVKRPVPDATQRQAWRRYFKKLRQQAERIANEKKPEPPPRPAP